MNPKTVLVLFIMFVLAACAPAVDTETPVASDPLMPVTGTFIVTSHEEARDFATRHIVAFFDVDPPGEWLILEDSGDDPDEVAVVYTSGLWRLRVEASDLELECIVYQIIADYDGEPGLHWEGSVDACGRIREDVVR